VWQIKAMDFCARQGLVGCAQTTAIAIAIARICNDVWQLGTPAKRRAFMPHQLPSDLLVHLTNELAQ
jgi:hypothetical protein